MVQTFETFAEKHIQQNTKDKDDEEFKNSILYVFQISLV